MTLENVTMDEVMEVLILDSDEEFPLQDYDEREINVFGSSSLRMTIPDDATAQGLALFARC